MPQQIQISFDCPTEIRSPSLPMSSDKINAITLTLKEQKEHVTTARGHTDKIDFKANTIFCAAYMVLASL